MMKHGIIYWFVTAVALVCLATAQTSQVRSSSAKPSPDPLQNATKPLTPKSAMPSHRKSSAAVPKTSTSARKTNKELTRLERQPIKATEPKSGNPGRANSASGTSATSSSGNGSGINATYQKPVPKKN